MARSSGGAPLGEEELAADIPHDVTTSAQFDGDPAHMATFSGELEQFGDRDWVAVTLTAGTNYEFHASVRRSPVCD